MAAAAKTVALIQGKGLWNMLAPFKQWAPYHLHELHTHRRKYVCAGRYLDTAGGTFSGTSK